jgi:hypothetical protein
LRKGQRQEGETMVAAKDGSRLCYLDASKVQSPVGELAGVELRSSSDQTLGNLDGVVIDARERRLLYFVVEKPGWFHRRKYLLPADATPRVERGGRALKVDVRPEELRGCEEFDHRAVREFSDDDLLAAMFARDVA